MKRALLSSAPLIKAALLCAGVGICVCAATLGSASAQTSSISRSRSTTAAAPTAPPASSAPTPTPTPPPAPASQGTAAPLPAAPATTAFGADWKPFFADPAQRDALPTAPIPLGPHYAIRLPKGLTRKAVTDKSDPGETQFQFDSGMQSSGTENVLIFLTEKLPANFPATKETLEYLMQVMLKKELPAVEANLQAKQVTPTERGSINGLPCWRVRVTGTQTDPAMRLKLASTMFVYVGYDAPNQQMVDLTGGVIRLDDALPGSTLQSPLEAAALTLTRR